MSKKYIFLTGKYLPTPGATGVCVHILAKYLAGKGECVTAICYEDGSGQNRIDGVEIVRKKTPSFFFDKQYQNRFERFKDVWLSRFMKLIHINQYPLRSSTLLKRYASTCVKLLKGCDEAVIIASYTPLEAVAALPLIKKKLPSVKIVYYSTDTLSNEQGNSGLLSAEKRTQMGQKWEQAIFSVCDLILIMECHKDHYYSDYYKAYQEKMRLVNFPLLNEPKGERLKTEKTMVYAGTLMRTLRNPQFACDTLLRVLPEADYEAVFMGSGDCDDIVNQAAEHSNGKLRFLGMQPYDIASEYIRSAGILLSIGNAESPMAPSKIYEYMATGKPIIHFYSWEQDPCLEPLKKYGNALLIKTNEKKAKEQIQEFIQSTRELDFDEVADCFKSSTPEYSANFLAQI